MNKKQILILIIIVAISFTCLFFYFKMGATGNGETVTKISENQANIIKNKPISPADIKKEIVYALAKKQLENGFIEYEFNFLDGKYTGVDNLIHQSEIGLVYIDYLAANPDDLFIKKAIEKLFNGLFTTLKTTDYGLMLSFNDTNNNDNEILKQKQLRAEISATALLITALSKYRILYNSIDFATTESYLNNTLLKIVDFLVTSRQIITPLYKYPPYEVWYAFAIYQQNNMKNREIDRNMEKLDRFFASIEHIISNKDSLFYFLRAFYERKDDASNYVVGSSLRNIRHFAKEYMNNYDSRNLDCENGKILNESLNILKFLNKDKSRVQLIERYINTSNNTSKKFLITGEKDWIPMGFGREWNTTDIKKFTGFFLSGYGNPISTIKNSISCYYAF